MTKTLRAVYDGKVLILDEPIDLEPNTSVLVTIELKAKIEDDQKGFLQTARSLQLNGPVDRSEKLGEYLYGQNPLTYEHFTTIL